MATRTWLDQDGNWNNTANWSGTTVPVSGDTIQILKGSQNISSNLNQASVLPASVIVGREFFGSIGSAGNPLIFGNTTSLKVNCPAANQLHFSFSGATLTDAFIEGTNNLPYALAFIAGTITRLNVGDCGRIYVGPCSVTTCNFSPNNSNGIAYIANGATLGTINLNGGRIDSDSDVDTLLKIMSGTFDFIGSSGGTMASITVNRTGQFIWRSPGSTVTLLNVDGGYVDGSVDDNAKTLTNANVWKNGVLTKRPA